MAAVAALGDHGLDLGVAHGPGGLGGAGRRGVGSRHGRRAGGHGDDEHGNQRHTGGHIRPGVWVAAQLVAVAQHKKLANGRACSHHAQQHQPVARVAVGKAVVGAEHGKEHRQREIGVVHAALFAALAVDGVYRLAVADALHHGSLAGDDPEKHIGTHAGGQHGAHQQKGGASGKPVTGHPGGHGHQQRYQRAHDTVAAGALAPDAANRVIGQPEHHQKAQRSGHCSRWRPVHQRFVDQIAARIPQVRDGKERKSGQPGAVAFPVKPVQMARQLGRAHRKFDGVVKAPAVHRPKLAADALALQLGVLRGREVAV